MRFAASVEITPRSGISDPEGQTIERALPVLGFEGVTSVRTGKLITFEVDADSADEARELVGEMCERFLSNPVIEDTRSTIADVAVVL